MVYYGKTLTYILKAGLCSVTSDGLLLTFTIPKNAFQWVEDGDTLYYCVDLRKVLSYNNITGFILDNILETDLGNALENGIDNLYDSLCRRGTNFSLDDGLFISL